MAVLNIQVDERGVKQVQARAGSIAEANEIAALSARIAIGLDLIGRLAVGDDKEHPAPAVELVGDAARFAELESANRQLQSFANELVRAVNDAEEAPRSTSDADLFFMGYELALKRLMPHLGSSKLAWLGWGYGHLEVAKLRKAAGKNQGSR